MKYELSMMIAGIRPHFWKNVYDTALLSCTRYPFEIVFIGPYDPPAELQNIDNVQYIKDFSSPTRASQIGAINCRGKLLAFPCDDGIFIPDGFNQAIDLYNSVCGHKDGIVCRYKEGAGMNAPSFPLAYWNANYHIGGVYIGGDWKIAPQPMMSLEYFKEIGGIDCVTYEAMAMATHDLCYRLQRDGGVFHLSPIELQDCDNYGAHGVDHSPIYHAQTEHDSPMFFSTYSNPNVINRVKINFDNWKDAPDTWSRRWKKICYNCRENKPNMTLSDKGWICERCVK
jgi:hypothetical protein